MAPFSRMRQSIAAAVDVQRSRVATQLLNKYIGASEAAVRSLFERASRCQPCILFFDEFDALAPRRGQDSTGVTDRVVNQLLCELDGIVGLHGVFVLAASNRPELIDPALLRPGRIDRKLLVGLPNLEDRETILRGLLRKAQSNVALATRALAARCDGCTGADLEALLANAQLAAAHEALESGSETGHIEQRHIDAALRTTPPAMEQLRQRSAVGAVSVATQLVGGKTVHA